MPLLTTITPYWGRPEMLVRWAECIRGSSNPEVEHLLIFVGERPPHWIQGFSGSRILTTYCHKDEPGKLSIGHYHGLGASLARTEWIMKLDVDALPNVNYFHELIPVLRNAGNKEWFNGGMFYADELMSAQFLAEKELPLWAKNYEVISRICSLGGSNFICRRKDYLALGGCDKRFQGWGWEDYQQIYMLESFQQGKDCLDGSVNLHNVTFRCRDEISRRKATELIQKNPWLGLVHHSHVKNRGYNSFSGPNRQVLLDYILTRR